jgi:GT2 family glycosyltransferase
VTLLAEPRPGAPAARNRGGRAASGELLVFTDHDCLAERRWLRELAAPFRDPAVGAAAGETVATPSTGWAARYLAFIRHNSAEASLARPVFPFASTGNLAVRRELFDRLGGFDESLHHTDDVDFTFRLVRDAGVRVVFVKRAIVFHEERVDARQLARRYRQYGEGWCGLVLKHPSELTWGFGRAVVADADVLRVLGAAAAAWVRWRLFRRDTEETFEFARHEFIRRSAHRAGFRAEARRRGHWTW